MKIQLNQFWAAIAFVFLLTACSTSNEVVTDGLLQKRKYRKGWHWNAAGKTQMKTFQKEKTASANEKEQTPIVQQKAKHNAEEAENLTASANDAPVVAKKPFADILKKPVNSDRKKENIAAGKTAASKIQSPFKQKFKSLKKPREQTKTKGNSMAVIGIIFVVLIIVLVIVLLAPSVPVWKILLWSAIGIAMGALIGALLVD